MTVIDQIRAIEANLAHERAAYEVAQAEGDQRLADHHLLAITTLLRELDFALPPCDACGLMGCDCGSPQGQSD